MKAMNFNTLKQHGGGAILENPMPLRAIFGWLGGENGEEPGEEKCDFDPL